MLPPPLYNHLQVLAVALDEICRERTAGPKAHGRVLHCLIMEQGGSELLAKKAEAQVGEAYGAAECSAAGRRIRSSLASLAEEIKSSASAAAQAVRAASGSEAEAKAAAVAAGYRVTQTRWEQRWRRVSSVGWVGCCLGAHRVHRPLRGGQPSASLARGQALSGEFTHEMLKVYF